MISQSFVSEQCVCTSLIQLSPEYTPSRTWLIVEDQLYCSLFPQEKHDARAQLPPRNEIVIRYPRHIDISVTCLPTYQSMFNDVPLCLSSQAMAKRLSTSSFTSSVTRAIRRRELCCGSRSTNRRCTTAQSTHDVIAYGHSQSPV